MEVVFNSTEEDKLAAELAEKVKVLCWVMTGPSNHQAKVTECNMSIIEFPLITNFPLIIPKLRQF